MNFFKEVNTVNPGDTKVSSWIDRFTDDDLVDRIEVMLYSDQNGTITIQESDISDVTPTVSLLVNAASVTQNTMYNSNKLTLSKRYYRVLFSNTGSTIATFVVRLKKYLGINESGIDSYGNLLISVAGSTIALPVDVQFSSLTRIDPLYVMQVDKLLRITSTITRPANTTAYAVGDVVGATTYHTYPTAFSEYSAGFKIDSVTLEVDADSTLTLPTEGFRLHLFNTAPSAIADNAAFTIASADRSKYLGSIAIPKPTILGATQWSHVNNIGFFGKLGDATNVLYGYLETLGEFTPTSGLVLKPTIYLEA